MDRYSQILELYDAYIREAENLEKNRKITDGLFGFGSRPSDHPCHEQFAEKLEELLSGAESDEAYTILRYIYTAPLEHRDPASVYWMLLAVHALTENLTESLTQEEAASLYHRYDQDYPRRERLPAQKKILARLKAAGGKK